MTISFYDWKISGFVRPGLVGSADNHEDRVPGLSAAGLAGFERLGEGLWPQPIVIKLFTVVI